MGKEKVIGYCPRCELVLLKLDKYKTALTKAMDTLEWYEKGQYPSTLEADKGYLARNTITEIKSLLGDE